MVSFQNVSKSYEKHQALEEVTFQIPKGKIFGLLGPNGAGKTTLLRIFTRMLLPDQGTITFDNAPLSDNHLVRIGYLPEERGLYPKMRVNDHLVFLAALKGLKKSFIKERLVHWGERLQTAHLFSRKIEELSKGQQQKVQLIAALLHQPDVLILDEPFSGFDPVNAELLKNILLELKSSGTTLVISTHRMENAEELCDELVILNQGKVMVQGSLQQVLHLTTNKRYMISASTPLHTTTLFDIVESNAMGTLIQAKDDISPNQLLEALMQQSEIYAFIPQRKSLREVFLETAQHHSSSATNPSW